MTDLDQKVRELRDYSGTCSHVAIDMPTLTAILDEYDRRGAALVEAEGALEAVGWLWRARNGMLKLTTWHPDCQADAAERLYIRAALPQEVGK